MITRIVEDALLAPRRSGGEPVIRPATEADVQVLTSLVNEHARQGHLLPRSADNIRASLANWLVAEVEGAVVGCGSLVEMSPALVEVRSLAVAPAYRSFGIGGRLVRALVEQARRRGIPTLFALTRAVPFFERLGFSVTSKERFPEKVWRDCIVCPLRQCCDETAVGLEL